MSQLPKIFKPSVARLHNDLPGVLHSADANDATRSQASSWDAGVSDKEKARTWPGKDIGVRAPDDWEVRLSDDEVRYLVKAWRELKI